MVDQLNLYDTEELQSLDYRHHLHPFTDSKNLQKVGCRIITKADGIYIWDSEGNRIIDGLSGLWCVNIGYGRQELVDAATQQMKELAYYNTFFQTSHPAVIELSERLSRIMPNDCNHLFFTNSGSEANDTIIRLVRRYWSLKSKPERSIIISRQNSYHGSTMGAASLGGMDYMHVQGGLPIPEIEHIQQPYWYREGGNQDPDDFGLQAANALEEKILELGVDKVAAFIAEPIQGAGGVIVPPKTYWPQVSKICKQYGVLLVADEVICGFGRTGKWFGSDHFQIEPNFITLAKGLSSGYLPIAGVAVSDPIASVIIEEGGEFAHGFTYSGHPVCCAVASENIRIMTEEKIVDQVGQVSGPYFQQQLRLLSEHPIVGDVRGVGLIAGVELVENKMTRKSYDAELNVGIRCRDISARRGLIMRAVGDSMVLAPPLIITKTQIDDMIQIIFESLDETYAELKRL